MPPAQISEIPGHGLAVGSSERLPEQEMIYAAARGALFGATTLPRPCTAAWLDRPATTNANHGYLCGEGLQ